MEIEIQMYGKNTSIICNCVLSSSVGERDDCQLKQKVTFSPPQSEFLWERMRTIMGPYPFPALVQPIEKFSFFSWLRRTQFNSINCLPCCHSLSKETASEHWKDHSVVTLPIRRNKKALSHLRLGSPGTSNAFILLKCSDKPVTLLHFKNNIQTYHDLQLEYKNRLYQATIFLRHRSLVSGHQRKKVPLPGGNCSESLAA